jgi:hypothetical protein
MSAQIEPQIHAIIKRKEVSGADILFAWFWLFIMNGLTMFLLGWSILGWIIRVIFIFHAFTTTFEYFLSSPSIIVVVDDPEPVIEKKENQIQPEKGEKTMKPEVLAPVPHVVETVKPTPVSDETQIIFHAPETARPGIRFCPNCGSELVYPNAMFCTSCGMKL